ncbi:MAG: hypothetical protein Q4C47_08735 [Planctomycetia bacterium]|nr:hypothetical protein [Planctomycetia bacterium]
MSSDEMFVREMEQLLRNRLFVPLTGNFPETFSATLREVMGITEQTKPAVVIKSLRERVTGAFRMVKYGKTWIIAREISQETLFAELKDSLLATLRQDRAITAGQMLETLPEETRVRLFLFLGLKSAPKPADMAKFCGFSHSGMIAGKSGTKILIMETVPETVLAESLKKTFLQIPERCGNRTIVPLAEAFASLDDPDRLRLKVLLKLRSMPKMTDLGKFCRTYLSDRMVAVSKKGAPAILRVVGPVRELMLSILDRKTSFVPGDLDQYQLTTTEKRGRADAINQLCQTGQIRVEVDTSLKVRRIHRVGSRSSSEREAPGTGNRSAPVSSAPVDPQTREVRFREACDRHLQGGLYARIRDVRRDLGWEREVFDAVLRDLRDRRIIQLQPGDTLHTTEQDIQDSFRAENNVLYLNVSWR